MSDTPETDAVLARLVDNQSGNSCDAVVIHHARKLERERDEARKERNAALSDRDAWARVCGAVDCYTPSTAEPYEALKLQRDALRAEVERLKSDEARLDWLEKRESMEGFTRDAIDAAMKGEL